MSVLVKGFDKPKNCRVCDFNSSDCFCKINHGKIDRDFWDCDKECPIVEVSVPHGRLIDYGWVVENVIKKLGIKDKQYLLQAEKALMILVDEAPTVIEAEGTE